jgi:hypothetical protein
MMRIIENTEDSIGNAKIIHEKRRIVNPYTIRGLRPILSDKDPVIGEIIM